MINNSSKLLQKLVTFYLPGVSSRIHTIPDEYNLRNYPGLTTVKTPASLDLLAYYKDNVNTKLFSHYSKTLNKSGFLFLDLPGKEARHNLSLINNELEMSEFIIVANLYHGFFSMIPGYKYLPDVINNFLFGIELKLHPYIRFVTGERMLVIAQKRPSRPEILFDLTVIIPAYNESQRIVPYLKSVISYLDNIKYTGEIIIIDDGSEDNTSRVINNEFLLKNKSKTIINLFKLYRNIGKGGAIQEGIRHSRGKMILISDADGSTPISELSNFINAYQTGYDIVIGSRYHAGSNILVKQSLYRRFFSRLGNKLIRMITSLPYYDTQCGFKLFDYRAAELLFRNLSNKRYGFDFEILSRAHSINYKIKELPVNWRDIKGSKVNGIDTIRTMKELLMLKFGTFVRFSTVGLINTSIDLTIHNILSIVFGTGDAFVQTFYNAMGFITANFVSYILNSGFTFKTYGSYTGFLIVSLATMYFSSIGYFSFNYAFNTDHNIFFYNFTKIIPVSISLITNYFGYRLLVFRNQI